MNDKETNNLGGTDIINIADWNKVINEIDGRYINKKEIGFGGQAKVYKVYDNKLKVDRAMKVLNAEFNSNKEFVDNFKREIQLTAKLNSPNIVKVYDADLINKEFIMIMDLVEGKTANQFTKLPKSIASIIAFKTAKALNYAHTLEIVENGHSQTGIIHRDIKPQNLMITKSGEVMVMDFGLSKLNEMETHTTSNKLIGSLPYLAPEQFDNIVSNKSDIYALGVSLYELITGKTGFESYTSQQIFAKKNSTQYIDIIDKSMLDDDLIRIIRQATHNNLDRRYSDISEMMSDLEQYIDSNYEIKNDFTNIIGAYINFSMAPSEKKYALPKQQSKTKYYIAGFAVILLIAVGLVFILTKNKSDVIASTVKDKLIEQVKKEVNVDIEDEIVEDPEIIQVNNRVIKKSTGGGKNTKKKVEVPQTSYYLTINNLMKVEGKIYINGRIINLGKYHEKIELPEKGTYDLKITSSGREDFVRTINLKSNKMSLDYQPSIYFIELSFQKEAENFDLYINGAKKGKLKLQAKKMYYYLAGDYSIKIKDPTNNYLETTTIARLGEQNKSYLFDVPLTENKKYNVKIENPNNIDGTITYNGKEEEFTGLFQESYSELIIRKFTIKAEGYESVTYEADFSNQPSYQFTYDPPPPVIKLVINNTVANGTVLINGSKNCNTTSGKTVISGLSYKSKYDIEIIAKGYKSFETEIQLNDFNNTIDYLGQPILGKITMIPELNEGLRDNVTLHIGNKSIPYNSVIENLPLGKVRLSLFFKIGDYSEKMIKEFKITEESTSHSWNLNINQVTITSSVTNTELVIDGKNVGSTPITIPFINKNIVTIKAYPKNQELKEKTINPKEYNNQVYRFNFPNRLAEEAYAQAVNLVDDYTDTNSESSLKNAKIKLKEAFSHDKNYPDAIMTFIKINSILVENYVKKNESDKVEKYSREAQKLYEENKSFLSDNSIHARILGYFGIIYFEKVKLLNSNSQKEVLLNESIENYLTKYSDLRKKIEAITTTEKFNRDKMDCVFAQTNQLLWEIDPTDVKKKKARKAWSINNFNDSSNNGKKYQNPFREIKNKEYFKLLDN